MKTSQLFPILLTVLVVLFSACKKDQDLPTPNDPNNPNNVDNIVGIWTVASGKAVVYDEGYITFDDLIDTEGEMIFNNDLTGSSDFTMTYDDITEAVVADFSWEIDGFELVMDPNTLDESRWSIVNDYDNLQELEFTWEDDDPNTNYEVNFSLTLKRK